MITVYDCENALELAIGEVNAVIPDEIIEATLRYLDEYKKLEIEKSWIDCPERMGR